MRLPELDNPARYEGLFVVDFGASCSVGFTAEEVAVLMDSEAHADATVYRIHRAYPDGRMELKGVPREGFSLETGMFLYHRDLDAARESFQALRRLAERAAPPCRAQLLVGSLPARAPLPFVVALAYPAECDQDVARWLVDHDVHSGEHADGGIDRLEAIRRDVSVIDSAQLHAAAARRSRPAGRVLAEAGRAVQRTA